VALATSLGGSVSAVHRLVSANRGALAVQWAPEAQKLGALRGDVRFRLSGRT
jgi:hypothetical protein